MPINEHVPVGPGQYCRVWAADQLAAMVQVGSWLLTLQSRRQDSVRICSDLLHIRCQVGLTQHTQQSIAQATLTGALVPGHAKTDAMPRAAQKSSQSFI